MFVSFVLFLLVKVLMVGFVDGRSLSTNISVATGLSIAVRVVHVPNRLLAGKDTWFAVLSLRGGWNAACVLCDTSPCFSHSTVNELYEMPICSYSMTADAPNV